MSIVFLTFLTGLVGFVAWKLLTWMRQFIAYRRDYMKIEGEPHHFFLGHLQPHQMTFPIGDVTFDFIMRCCKNFDWRPFRIMLGPFKHAVALSHPDDMQIILKTTEPKAEVMYSMLRPWLGEGLLIASGKLWFRNRRLLTPAFHFDVLKPYATVFSSCVETTVRKLALSAEKQAPVEVFGVISRMTLDTLLHCALSYESNCQITESEKIPYVKAVFRISELVVERALSIAYQSDFIYGLSASGREFKKLTDFVHDYAENIIRTRRRALEEKFSNGHVSNRRYRDFIDILLEARDEKGQGLSDKEIRNEVDTFMFEGHDTTASGITWTLYCLAQHPEYQARICDEVRKVLDGKTDFDWESLNSLTFTSQCIRESMRLYPPVPTIHRELTKEIKVRDHVLPKGQWIFLNITGLHYNPEFWEDPEDFIPDRIKSSHPFAYVPFSAGPRNCIGQQFAFNEERMAVAKIISRYEVELVEDNKFERVLSVILKPVPGLMLRFKERQN